MRPQKFMWRNIISQSNVKLFQFYIDYIDRDYIGETKQDLLYFKFSPFIKKKKKSFHFDHFTIKILIPKSNRVQTTTSFLNDVSYASC